MISTAWRTLGLLIVALAAMGCGNGDDSGATDGTGATASGGSAGSGSGAAGGVAGGEDGGSTGGSTGCITFGDTPPPGVSILFEPASSNSLFAAYGLLGLEGGAVYVTEGTEVKRVPLDGGATESVFSFAAGQGPIALRGGYYVYRTTSATANMSDVTAAPTSNPTNAVAVATVPNAYVVYYAPDALYWETRDPYAIWQAPYTGAGSTELVPGGSPLGMVVHDGYLYWTDFATETLMRVPTTGGTAQTLADAFYGGPMAADGNSIYYSDTSLEAVKRFTLGQTADETLFSGDFFDGPGDITAQNGSAYFLVGTFCNELYGSAAPGGATKLVSGFDDGGSLWATPSGIVVADSHAVYLVHLP